MHTSINHKFRWALEDSGRLALKGAGRLAKCAAALGMAYILAPPLWDAVFAPTMAAAYELPYAAARRADRALSMAEHLGVRLPAIPLSSACGRVSTWMSHVRPMEEGDSDIHLLRGSGAGRAPGRSPR